MENNKNKTDYSKAVEEELKVTSNPSSPSSTLDTSTPTPSKKKTILLPILVIIAIFLIAGIITIIAVSMSSSPVPVVVEDKGNNDDEEEDKPEPTFAFEMPKLDLEVELPESLKGKVFSRFENGSYYIWGYTGDSMPEYADENSDSFFPLFAMNYSEDAFSTDKYIFDSGAGAHGREDDDRVLFLHSLLEVKGKELNESNLPEQLLDDYYMFVLYFRDGFKYHDL